MTFTPPSRLLSLLVLGAVVGVACSAASPTTSVMARPAAASNPAAQPVAAVAPPDPVLVDKRIFVEGDSLTVGVAAYLSGLLSLDGWTVTVDAQVGRTTVEGVAQLEQRTSQIGGTLVVALGTNDGPDPTAYAARIDEVMILASGRKVIWVTPARAGWDRMDEALLAAQSKWANLEVIDWRPVIAAHPYELASDGIHLTLAGYQIRAQFIADAVEAQA